MAINAIYIRADSSAMNETGDEDDNKSGGRIVKATIADSFRGLISFKAGGLYGPIVLRSPNYPPVTPRTFNAIVKLSMILRVVTVRSPSSILLLQYSI